MSIRSPIIALLSRERDEPDALSHFRETFLSPVRESVSTEARAEVEAGRQWSKAAGPLLVVLTPAA
ncbi:hypothetical protein GCM10020295_52340 [Streptomyces cinereospinus]